MNGQSKNDPLKLEIPKKFLEAFFKYLYYSICPELDYMEKRSSIILEPICFFRIMNMKIVEWKSINEYISRSYKIQEIRWQIRNAIRNADISNIDQVLIHLTKNIYSITDNPLIYPWERLRKFILEYLTLNPDILNFIDGICHFHPSETAQESELDERTLKKILGIFKQYNKTQFISLVLAKGHPYKYVGLSKYSIGGFVKYMISNFSNESIEAKVYYPNKVKKINTIITCD